MQKILFACLFLALISFKADAASEGSKGLAQDLLDIKGMCSRFWNLFTHERSKAYPPNFLSNYFVDIHFYSGELEHQYIVYHYCTFLNDGMQQCALYNGKEKDSRMIGVEYIISKEIFESLPEDEKLLWHSHIYEVKSGLLAFPDLTFEEEWKILELVVGTYGKVLDTWNDGDDFPYGAPKLANALAMDSQVDWDLAKKMDKEMDVHSTYEDRKKQRESLKVPEKAKGADSYLDTGKAPQFEIVFRKQKNTKEFKK